MYFFCGNVYALPQDWPCEIFELEKYKEIEDADLSGYNIMYRGQSGDYAVSVNVYWRVDMWEDDCGTAGCGGTIKNTKTGQKENLTFFCVAEDDYKIASCSVRTGEEYILPEVSEGYYQVSLCNNAHYKYVHLRECSGCVCVVHDSRNQNGEFNENSDSDFYMGCKKHENYLHCMKGTIYSEKYNPAGEVDDFRNCVGLTSFQ